MCSKKWNNMLRSSVYLEHENVTLPHQDNELRLQVKYGAT